MKTDEIPKVLADQGLDTSLAPEVMQHLAERESSLAALEELNLKEPVLLGKVRIVNTDTRAKITAATDAAIDRDPELKQIRADQQRIRNGEATGTTADPEWDDGLKAAWSAFPDARGTLADLDAQRMQAGRRQLTNELPARIAVVGALHDPEGIVREWQELEVAGHPTAVRALGTVVEARLRALATSERAGVRAQADRALVSFRVTFGAWSDRNPSPLTQIERLDERARARVSQIRRASSWAAKHAGLGDRSAVVVEGPAFEQ